MARALPTYVNNWRFFLWFQKGKNRKNAASVSLRFQKQGSNGKDPMELSTNAVTNGYSEAEFFSQSYLQSASNHQTPEYQHKGLLL